MEGKGAGEAEVMEARVGAMEGVMEGAMEGVTDADAEGAPTKGAPASVESGSNPSRFRRAPKRQTNLLVK